MRLRKQIYVCTAQDTHTQTARAAHNNWKSFFFSFCVPPRMPHEIWNAMPKALPNHKSINISNFHCDRAPCTWIILSILSLSTHRRWAPPHSREQRLPFRHTNLLFMFEWLLFSLVCLCVCVCIGGDTAPTINKEWMAGRALPTLSHLLFYTVVLLTRGWLSTDGARHNARAFDTEGRCG